MVDMIEGKISYTKNGIFIGLAFENVDLAKGELYPAVSSIFEKDEFEVIYPQPEDWRLDGSQIVNINMYAAKKLVKNQHNIKSFTQE